MKSGLQVKEERKFASFFMFYIRRHNLYLYKAKEISRPAAQVEMTRFDIILQSIVTICSE